MRIPFGEWAPDVADLGTDFLTIARNVYPAANSWRPARDLLAASASPLPLPCRCLCFVQKTDGTYDTYAATAAKIYRYNADTLEFDDVSRVSGGDYNLPSDDYWDWAKFGNRLILTQLGDDPQFIDIDVGTNFAALPNAPRGRFISVADDRVVLAHLTGQPNRIDWSAINDSEDWTSGTSGNQEFADLGAVMGFYPSANLVLLETGLRGIIPTGDVNAFNFSQIASQKGTTCPYATVEFGNLIYWVSEDGIYAGNANGHQNISNTKVSDYFFANLNHERHFQVLGTFDPFSPRILFSYPTGDTEYNDRILVYDWQLNRWGELELDTYVLARLATAGVSMDGGSDSTDMDEAGLPSLDSRIYMAGAPVLVAVGTDLNLSTQAGDMLEATLQTSTYQFNEAGRTQMQYVTPLVVGSEAENVTVKVRKKARMGDDWVTSSSISQQASGRHPMRADGAFHQFEFTMPAASEWEHMIGWLPEFTMKSRR